MFTHDDRLPEAVRRLAFDATVIEVTRREGSVVELREGLRPGGARHLADATALVRTRRCPRSLAQQVVPGYCRSAIEAACIEVVSRRRSARDGRVAQSVEAALAGVTTLNRYLALALFDDAGRGGDVQGGFASGANGRSTRSGSSGAGPTAAPGVARGPRERCRSALQQDRPAVMAGVTLVGPDARTLLSSADDVLSTPSEAWAGRWPRAVALLTRQALERSLEELWAANSPPMLRASLRAPTALPAPVGPA